MLSVHLYTLKVCNLLVAKFTHLKPCFSKRCSVLPTLDDYVVLHEVSWLVGRR